jgi:hypothetical protein
MQFSQLLGFFGTLLLVSSAAINARSPDVAGITVFSPPAETPSLHALEKRKPKTTIIIIIIVVQGVAANGVAAATEFGQGMDFETFTTTSTHVPAVTDVAVEGFFGAVGEDQTVTLSSARSLTLTTTKFAAPMITDAVVAE